MTLTKKPFVDCTPSPHVATDTPHVYRDTKTNKFVYSDETQCFSDREYDSEALAAQAMRDYCAFSLDGPALLEEIKHLLNTIPGIDTYTCVHVAQAVFKDPRGHAEDAIIALRSGVDKLRVHSERLYVLVRNNPQLTPVDLYRAGCDPIVAQHLTTGRLPGEQHQPE